MPKYGKNSFSINELTLACNTSSNNIQQLLNKLQKAKLISSIVRGFYVITPIEYQAKGIVPPSIYILDLMKFLDKKYYVGLLSSAAYYGATHQQSQAYTVITEIPIPNLSPTKHPELKFFGKKIIPNAYLRAIRGKSGDIPISSPELTAIDLLTYAKQIGGLNRIATILSELAESIDFNTVSNDFFDMASVATYQRLGYILEEIVGDTKTADGLFEKMAIANLKTQRAKLKSDACSNFSKFNKKWKIEINTTIEIDE